MLRLLSFEENPGKESITPSHSRQLIGQAEACKSFMELDLQLGCHYLLSPKLDT